VAANEVPYDLYGPPPTDRLATIRQPTLVATGGSNDYFEQAAADAVTARLPARVREAINGQGPRGDPQVMAAVLARFFST
jgi:hypothetical protein